ncbi:MAG: KamA family radical SAM protein [Verrucomicrobiota bacterium]
MLIHSLEVPFAQDPVRPWEEDTLLYRRLREGEYWRHLPGFANVSVSEFETHQFQQKSTVTSVDQLRSVLGDIASEEFYDDLALGMRNAPMALRISPHLLALIDWNNPTDPVRSQFLPLRRLQQPDHPMLQLDSLGERKDSPVPGLTHRYPDKALFLPVDSCPVYCRFCTRSYAVGVDTELVSEKLKLHANQARWDAAFEYIESRPALEDIVISGGDTFNLRPDHLEAIGMRLLAIPHVRRLRFATKGLCVMPQKILSDHKWTDALTRVVEQSRRLHKSAVVHTHFNHPSEVLDVTRRAMNLLVERGITVRCQTVLQNGVNASASTMQLLVKRLGFVNIHPYYVYFHDLVPGVEDLRTSLATGLAVEKQVRGITAGFHTPAFVVDTMGGGGKRDAHSFEYYDREQGIAVFTSPSVKPGQHFLYFDPLSGLAPAVQHRWKIKHEREEMIQSVLRASGVASL